MMSKRLRGNKQLQSNFHSMTSWLYDESKLYSVDLSPHYNYVTCTISLYPICHVLEVINACKWWDSHVSSIFWNMQRNFGERCEHWRSLEDIVSMLPWYTCSLILMYLHYVHKVIFYIEMCSHNICRPPPHNCSPYVNPCNAHVE